MTDSEASSREPTEDSVATGVARSKTYSVDIAPFCTVREATQFSIHAVDDEGDAVPTADDPFTISIRGVARVRAHIVRGEDRGLCTVEWKPPHSGPYIVTVSLEGVALPGSPFDVVASTPEPFPSQCIVRGKALHDAVARDPQEFFVHFRDRLGTTTHAVDLDVFVEPVGPGSPREADEPRSSSTEPASPSSPSKRRWTIATDKSGPLANALPLVRRTSGAGSGGKAPHRRSSSPVATDVKVSASSRHETRYRKLRVRVLEKPLIVREGPELASLQLGQLLPGAVVTVIEERVDHLTNTVRACVALDAIEKQDEDGVRSERGATFRSSLTQSTFRTSETSGSFGGGSHRSSSRIERPSGACVHSSDSSSGSSSHRGGKKNAKARQPQATAVVASVLPALLEQSPGQNFAATAEEEVARRLPFDDPVDHLVQLDGGEGDAEDLPLTPGGGIDDEAFATREMVALERRASSSDSLQLGRISSGQTADDAQPAASFRVTPSVIQAPPSPSPSLSTWAMSTWSWQQRNVAPQAASPPPPTSGGWVGASPPPPTSPPVGGMGPAGTAQVASTRKRIPLKLPLKLAIAGRDMPPLPPQPPPSSSRKSSSVGGVALSQTSQRGSHRAPASSHRASGGEGGTRSGGGATSHRPQRELLSKVAKRPFTPSGSGSAAEVNGSLLVAETGAAEGWVTLVRHGEKFVSSRLRLDVTARQLHETQWARRSLTDRLNEEDKLARQNPEDPRSRLKDSVVRSADGPSLARAVSLELDQDVASFAFGGLFPGTLHAHGQLRDSHKVSYSIGVAGKYLLHVRLRKQAAGLPGSPFLLRVVPGPAYALSSSLPFEPLDSEVGDPIVHVMRTADRIGNGCQTGGARVECKCSQNGREATQVEVSVKDRGDGTYELSWSSLQPGRFDVSVKVAGEHVLNSPSVVRFHSTVPVFDKSRVIEGPGLHNAVVGERSSITFSLNDQYGNEAVPGKEYRQTFRVFISFIRQSQIGDSTNDVPQIEAEGEWLRDDAGDYVLHYVPSSANQGFTELFVWCDPHGTGERIPLPGSPFKLSISALQHQVVSNDIDTSGATAGDYRITRSVFEEAQETWGTCTLDAFASEPTALVDRFWTAQKSDGSCGTDALQQKWPADERIWAHPPPKLLPELTKLLMSSERQSEVIVCAPFWPSSPWYRDLHSISDERRKYRAGKLQKLPGINDAPDRLGSWPIVLFHVPAPFGDGKALVAERLRKLQKRDHASGSNAGSPTASPSSSPNASPPMLRPAGAEGETQAGAPSVEEVKGDEAEKVEEVEALEKEDLSDRPATAAEDETLEKAPPASEEPPPGSAEVEDVGSPAVGVPMFGYSAWLSGER